MDNEDIKNETKDEMSPKDYALIFAKALTSQVINDPDGKTSRAPTRSYSGPTKESIEGWLKSPSANQKNLRDASILLYQINTRYRNLINYYAEIPSWVYVVSPAKYNPDKTKRDSFKKQYLKVCNILETMNVEKTMRDIVTTALREGAFYGCIWGGAGDSFILQKLDPDNCTIVSVTDGGVFQFVYDVSKIKDTDVDSYYPPQFREMYNNYVATGEKYQLVPPEISVCYKADPTIVEYSIPIFAGTFPTLFQIENIKELAETAAELSNYKLISGLLPVDDEGVPLIDYETAMNYYKHISNNVGDRVGVAIAPFKLDDHTFEQNGTTAQIDTVARASENYFSEAGTSALLHGATNNTSGVTKLGVKVDEAFAFGLMYQCEAIINKLLRLMSGTVKFKIHFLEVSCFNREEKLEQYKGAMNYGISKLEYLATLGVRQHDILGENYIESELLDVDNLFTPMKTASTQSSDGTGAGRPEASDEEISDEGEKTRDGDKNANR